MHLGRRALMVAGGTSVIGVGAAALGGRSSGSGGAADPSPTIRVACGTTLYDSGLAEPLAALATGDAGEWGNFDSANVDLLPRGTGAALRAIEDGDAHVALVHHPAAERELVDAGDAVDRRPLCANDFLIVGPPEDPAEVQRADTVPAAFDRVAEADTRFVSRGDDSGTHARERQIWHAADRTPDGEWYVETGASMGETVRIAGTVGAYTLVDRGTFLNRRGDTGLAACYVSELAAPPSLLENVYHVLRAAPDRIGGETEQVATAFADLVTGKRGQSVVEEFRIDGERAFRPIAGTDSSETVRINQP